jgi:UDP-N-acetylmuramoyl-tripeptide--D-alanyl-D-alanine ligase
MSVAPSPLWTGLGLVGPLEARFRGALMPMAVGGVSIDTRTLAKGDLFFAIKGERDGHEFVRAALEKGAAAAVIDESHAHGLKDVGPLYIVRDTLASLVSLGRAARARSKARVVGVTGSVGKTSVKEALRVVLGAFGETHASAASYNNHWGVPLSLSRFPSTAKFGVFEIGMNHPGEITPLVGMVRPHVALITTIAPAHLEHMGSLEAIADAKAEILSGVAHGGAAILPRDVSTYERLRAAAKESPVAHVITFGESEDADARLVACTPEGDGSKVEADILGVRVSYALGAPGRHAALNSLATLLAARLCGCELDEAAAAMAKVRPAKGRGARETLNADGGALTLIDEAYNANPTSMRAALALLGQTRPGEGGRRIAAIGDMLELGAEGGAMHAALADDLAAANVDLLFAAGPLSRRLFEATPKDRRGAWGATSAEIVDAVIATARAGDVIMVKGSNGSRMGAVVAALQRHFGEPRSRVEG